MTQPIRSFLISFVTVCIILGVAGAIITYGRGYRLHSDGSVQSTGLIVLQSDPSGAQIIVDGKIKTATQATLTLPPGWYDITIAKDGFQPWQKRMKVQGEVVAKVEALLLPINPSLTALTATGVVNPVLSPDGSRLAYIIPNTTATTSANLATTKPGVWVLDLVDKPLGLNRDAKQIATSRIINFSKATLLWSPDNKDVLASLSPTTNYLLDAEEANTSLAPVSDIKLLQSEWKTIKEDRVKDQLVTVPLAFTSVASQAASLIAFSPDETKILYEATGSATIPLAIIPPIIGTNPTEESRMLVPNNIYVYDIKDDRNYLVAKRSQLAPTAAAQKNKPTPVFDVSQILHWLPTSKHLVVVSKDKVEIMDYDGVNKRTAYGGPFWDSFAVPWVSGGKLVILTNLNSAASAVNNLYIVNLR